MTDHPRDDDLLRSALHAEADDVHADDAFHARIRAASAPGTWRWRTTVLALAAAVALVAGLAAVLLTRDDGDPVVLQDPGPTELAPADLRELLGALDQCAPSPDGVDPVVRVTIFMEPAALDPDADLHAAAVTEHLEGRGIGSVDEMTPTDVLARLRSRYPEDPGVASLTAADVPQAHLMSVATPDEATDVVAQVSDLSGVWATSVTDCRDHTDTTETTVVAAGERPTLVAITPIPGLPEALVADW